jgi:glucose/arabinose dehydrogenase
LKHGSRIERNRHLRFEPLEQRLFLAGDTYLINFQPAGAPIPTRYAPDSGEVFGLRSNGWSYGWSSDHTTMGRERGAEADQRLDTLIHFHQGQSWELALPNGLYEVTAAVGDASFSSTYTLNVESVNYWNSLALTAGDFRVKTLQVTVGDGRLTLNQGAAGEMATRIDYLHVVGLPSGPNISPATPSITEPTADGEEVNPADVHMEAVGFTDPDGNNHLSTDWEIWTVGSSPELVWQTLGITGVEKLHTHLGDGIFENSHAGRTDLISESVTNFNFNTYTLVIPGVTAGNHLTVTAEMIDATGGSGADLSGMVDAFSLLSPTSQNLISDGSFELSSSGTQTSNSAWVMTAQSDGVEPAAQFQSAPWAASSGSKGVWFKGFRGSPGSPVDARVTQVVTATVSGDYTLSFSAKVEANFASVIGGFRVTITSDGTGSSQTIELLEPPEYELRARFRDDGGAVSNYATRRFKVGAATTVFPLELEDIASSPPPSWLNAAGNAVVLPAASPTQPQLRVEGGQGELLLSIAGQDGLINNVSNPPPLTEHVKLRVVITGGSHGLELGETDLRFFDDHGQEWTVYLPAVDLAANERLDLWVAAGGSTYYGTAAQTEPDFSNLAREADLPIPFIALQPGYTIDEVAGGFQLPVNIAFVPNPGPDPNDPLFYVNELYGTIKVVTNDFTVSNYAMGLLNFDPTGNFPGSGEQGLTGLVVDPLTGDLFVTRATDTDGLPGGVHHPQVLRLNSNDGGRTASSITVILNMVGETQGQSHQVSNATIGPDGMLYIHNGDGFDSSTALNLNSYRGKILRMNLNGTAPADNPLYNAGDGINARDYIYAYGFRNPFGGAWRASDGKHYEVENGNALDRLVRVDRGGNYDWNGSDASLLPDARYVWNPAHAPVNITFVQPETFGGSLFPAAKQDHAFVSESGPTYALGPQLYGKRIVEFTFDASGNVIGSPTTFIEYVGTGYATVVGLSAGPDGLYFTELYKDQDVVSPIDAGARVFRVRFAPAGNGDFNSDGSVDAADYIVWRKTLGTTGIPAYFGADGDGDTTIDQDDYTVWRNHFGLMLSAAGAGSAASRTSVFDSQAARAEALPTSPVAAELISEPDAQRFPRMTSVFVGIDASATAAANRSVINVPSRWQDQNSRLRGTGHQWATANSSGDDLLLLAIDRVGIRSRQANCDYCRSENDEHSAAVKDGWNPIDESLALALADWQ